MTGGSTPWLQAAAVLAALMAAAVWASPTWPGEPQRRPTMTVVPGGGPVSERPLVEIVGRVLREDRSPIADARAMLIGIDEVCRAAARDLPAFTKGAVGVIRSVQTDAEGSYSFDAVPPGRYTVTVVPLAAEPGSTGQFVVGDCLRYKCDPLCLRTIPEADGVRATRDVCFDDLPELLACHVAISPVAATDLDGRIVHIVERGPQFVRLGPPAGAAADAAGDRRVVAIRLPADPLPPETTATLVSVRARPEQLIRYVGWAPTAGTDRAEFAAVPPGEYFLTLSQSGAVHAAGFVSVGRDEGTNTVNIVPQWVPIDVKSDAGSAEPVQVCVAFAESKPSATPQVARPWGIAAIIDGFPARRHRASGARLWVVRDPDRTCVLTAETSTRIGSRRLPLEKCLVPIDLRMGAYVFGRTPRAADLLLCSSDGWGELALLPRTTNFRIGPLPQGRYVLASAVISSRHDVRIGTTGFAVDNGASDAATSLPIALEDTFGPRTAACVFGWPPPGCDVYLYRSGQRTSALRCMANEYGFASIRIDRREPSMTVVFVPRDRAGPTFGTTVHFEMGSYAVEFPTPATTSLVLDDPLLRSCTTVDLQVVRGHQQDYFVQAWSKQLSGETSITLPCIPRNVYLVRYRAGERVLGTVEVDLTQ